MSESKMKRTFNRRKPHTNLCRGSKVIDINLPDSENFFDVVMKEESHWGISRLILTKYIFVRLFKRTFILYKNIVDYDYAKITDQPLPTGLPFSDLAPLIIGLNLAATTTFEK